MTSGQLEAIVEPSQAEWDAICDCGGIWERLQVKLRAYGLRVAREAVLKADTERNIAITMSIDGATFKASGPKGQVEKMYAEWREMSGLNFEDKASKAFNAPRWK